MTFCVFLAHFLHQSTFNAYNLPESLLHKVNTDNSKGLFRLGKDVFFLSDFNFPLNIFELQITEKVKVCTKQKINFENPAVSIIDSRKSCHYESHESQYQFTLFTSLQRMSRR